VSRATYRTVGIYIRHRRGGPSGLTELATDPDDDSLPLPEGIEAQTRKVMDNLKRALAGAGAGFEHVVYVRIFLTDFERDYAAFNQLYTDYFRPHRLPARTTVGVTHSARSGIVEVDLSGRAQVVGRPLHRRDDTRTAAAALHSGHH
jgi:enamine deaminase RidA (YjgF/YER057c/UK114 family)